MAHADVDDLAALVIEPADVPDPVRRHVSACSRCSATVEALTTTRGALGADPLVAPPPDLRARVMAEALGRPTATASETGTGETPPSAPVPLASRRRGVPVWLASAAAVLALVAGLGVGRMSVGAPEAAPVEPEPTGSVLAATSLTALDSDAPRGAVEAVNDADDVVTVSVRATELGDEPGFHEVWLINVDGERMVALGILARSDNGTFEVPRRLLEQGYRIVDISVEPDDGDPTHSGVSLARGELV